MKTPTTNPTHQYALNDLAEILVRHEGIHEGLYDLTVEFQFAVGAVGPAPESLLPGAMVGISRIGIVQSPQAGPNTVDAAKVNPSPTIRKKATAR